MAPQITGEITMAYLTKKQERERFIDEFLQRLREAPPGTRVYMRVGDVFRDADVVSIDELRAAREAALVRDHDDNEGEDTCR
jgi:predicted secreted acid phosphatase